LSPWLSDTLLRAQSDDRLVALAREGHERAFAAIAERYRRRLLAFAGRLVPDQRAEDVVQQSLLAAWRSLDEGAEVRHLSGWLYRIVRNTAARTLAGAPAEEALSDRLVAYELVESEAERRAQLRATLAGVAALPERQRRALVGTAVEGRSCVEVAASLGLSEGAVRQLVHRARATLRGAASAITPAPLAQWAAQAGPARPPTGTAERVAELAAGAAGSASAAGIALKAGTVIAVTGAVAAGIAGGGAPASRNRDGTGVRGRPTGAPLAGPGVAAADVQLAARLTPAGAGSSPRPRSLRPLGAEPSSGRQVISGPSAGERPGRAGPRHPDHGAGDSGGRPLGGGRGRGEEAPPRPGPGRTPGGDEGHGSRGGGATGAQPGGDDSQPHGGGGDAAGGGEPEGEPAGSGGGTSGSSGDPGEARSAERPPPAPSHPADGPAPSDPPR